MTRPNGFYWVIVKDWVRGNPTIAEWDNGTWWLDGAKASEETLEILSTEPLKPPNGTH